MKKYLLIIIAVLLAFSGPMKNAYAGEIDVLVDKLVEKGILTAYEAQILLAEAKEESARELSQGKASTAPSWTQKVSVKGDVRFRTQVDWQDNHADSGGRNVRERVRARVGVYGKVNDQVSAGVRVVTGSDDSRSTNESLSDNGTFAHPEAHLDLYYIDWAPKLPNDLGTSDVILGKMKNPFEKTELLWDGDVTPEGVAGKFTSSTFDLGNMPTNLYLNGGYFMLREDSWTKAVPMMAAVQGGLKADIISDWDSGVNLGIAYYDFANVADNLDYLSGGWAADSAGTNTQFATGTAGRFRYDFNLVDFLIKYDSKKFFDLEMGHGLFTDMIWNTDPGSDNFGIIAGGYLGKKKVKKPGEWKLFANYRYIEVDAVPDWLGDSDFTGWSKAGATGGGGTNAQGLNCGLQYAIFKNTVLGIEYYYMDPIDLNTGVSGDIEPYQILQADVVVKF